MSPEDEGPPPSNLSALPSQEPEARCRALLQLADHAGPRPELWPFLEDTDAAVRVAAVHALWQTGTGQDHLQRLVEVLRDVLALPEDTAPHDDAVLMAGTVLQRMGRPAVRPLTTGFRADAPHAHRIVWVLADMETDNAIDFLRGVADGPDSKGKQEAQRALLELQSESSTSAGDEESISVL